MHRSGMVPKSNQIGIWQHKRHPTTRGRSARQLVTDQRAIQTRCGVALRPAYPLHRKPHSGTRLFGGKPAKQGSKSRVLRGSRAAPRCNTWLLKCLSIKSSVAVS